MQFDKDLNSEHAELFLETRDFIKNCIGEDAKDRYKENLTALHSSEGSFCYIKTHSYGVHLGWFNGVRIDDKYGFLFGDGKILRGQIIKKLDKKTKIAIEYYVNETLIYLIEHNELLKMRRSKKLKNKEPLFSAL